IVASDAATSGLAPAYCTIDLNLPLEMPPHDLASLWEAIHQACEEIGMAIVTGHTGHYQGCNFPTVGGMTVICLGDRHDYLVPSMARPGDDIVITKGVAIETTGMLGAACHDRITESLGPELAGAAAELFWEMSVVRDARIANSVGVRGNGVTGMHDATERGVWNALCEIAEASGRGLVVDETAVPIRPVVRAVCDLFGIDPYTTSSEGTLLLTCTSAKTGEVLNALEEAGIPARRIGRMTPRDEGVRVVREGREEPLLPPESDPFWPAYSAALRGDTA
ncbi:MAG: AIR synthase-related protein, partial [Chloroflexota bacterium]|nr:AIR synthase-related protein [Chloroflexota bacterium]